MLRFDSPRIARPFATVLLGAAAIAGVACSADSVTAPSATVATVAAPGTRLNESPPSAMPMTRLDFATYDGSHEVVHPDVLRFPDAWHGARFWAVLTPYPNSATRFENPSLFTSDDGHAWSVPAGLTNPIGSTTRGYLSDPDMVFDSAGKRLRLYFREVVNQRRGQKEAHQRDIVWTATSTDGVRWDTPQQAVQDSGRFVVSPTVAVGPDGGWRMWSVDAGRAGCSAKDTKLRLRTSTDGVRWGQPTELQFDQPGYLPWHLDVQYVPERREYWALVAAYARGSACTATDLFLATSTDGVRWTTYASPVVTKGVIPEFGANVYRSTFAYTAGDSVTLWLTGARVMATGSKKVGPVLQWNAATAKLSVSGLLHRVRSAAGAAQARRAAALAPAVRDVVTLDGMP